MAKSKIEISRAAEKQLRKLPRGDRQRIVEAVLALTDEPVPRGACKLVGTMTSFGFAWDASRLRYQGSVTVNDVIIPA